jgi:hypothetical protein
MNLLLLRLIYIQYSYVSIFYPQWCNGSSDERDFSGILGLIAAPLRNKV